MQSRRIFAACALAGALVLTCAAGVQAQVSFDLAFGWDVAPPPPDLPFENCTTATGCVTGTESAAAGGMEDPEGIAIDAQGRILVADRNKNRVTRFLVGADGTVSVDRVFGVGVAGGSGFENCTTGCHDGDDTDVAGGMSGPSGVAVDGQGRIVVVETFNNRVSRFLVAADGTVSFDRAFGIGVATGGGNFENCTTTCQQGVGNDAAGGLDQPLGVAIDGQGRILVTELNNNRISRFLVAADGTVSFDRAFGSGVLSGVDAFQNCTSACQSGNASNVAGGFQAPRAVAVDALGRILVADGFNHRVSRFLVAADGTVSHDRTFGFGVATGASAFENCTTTCATGIQTGDAGALGDPRGVAVDAQGRILVSEFENNRVSRFLVAADGAVSFDRAFGVGVLTGGAAFETCTTTCQSGIESDVAGGLIEPQKLVVDAQGGILAPDGDTHRVNRFTIASDGTVTFARAFGIDVIGGNVGFESCTAATGCQGGGDTGRAGAVALPRGIAVDAQGRVVVADDSNQRVSRFLVAADGTVSFDRAFGVGVLTGVDALETCTTVTGCLAGLEDAGPGMSSPAGVAVDAQGRILVADSSNHRVTRYVVDAGGTASFDRTFGVGVNGGGGFENCTTASSCLAGTASDQAGGMNVPFGLAVDAQGRIYVVEQGNHRVSRFLVAADGTVSFDRAFGAGVAGGGGFENCTTTCQIGIQTGGPGGMIFPLGVAIDAQGRILVANNGNVRVDRYVVAADGSVSFDRAFGWGITGVDAFANCTTDCVLASSVPDNGGALSFPSGVAVDPLGRILVTETLFHPRVSRFLVAANGTVSFDRAFGIGVATGDEETFENCTGTCQAGVASEAAGGVRDAEMLTVDGRGRILVSDRINNRVSRYTSGFRVTYDGNGNTGGSVPVDAQSYETGDTVTVKANTGGLVRTGHTFAGWNTQADGGGTSYAATGSVTFVMGTANVTLFARWTAVLTHTVSFNSNGGTAVPPQIVPDGGTATAPTPPTKPGGTFVGWFTDAALTTPFSFATPITGDITLFAKWIQSSFTGPSPTGTGTITASLTGGSVTCGFTSQQFVPESAIGVPPPPGITFPHGLFAFTVGGGGCALGGRLAFTIVYPAALPPGTQYWKYGPTPTDPTPHWYVLPAVIAGNTVTFSITDGGLGDDDLTPNGIIVDPGGPGVTETSIPTMSTWALLALALGVLGLGAHHLRRTRAPA